MTSKLGVYWSVMHRRPQDYDFFKRLQPSVFKIMDGGPPDYEWARVNLPNSLIIARDHPLSEQHADMMKDPIGTGKRHAQEWNQHQARLGFDRAKTLILGVNEPHVWEPGVPEALRLYTIALCDEATKFGLRVGAMQLSVGWPNNDGPDTPPNWEAWHGVDNAIRHNNGALICHEYWADNGPGELWGWWAGRVLKCPWQVPIVIGECGVDMYVKDGTVERHKRGWRGRLEPERYARELAEYVGRMSADERFVGCAVFASDYASQDWFSFDIEPAYQAILATPIPDIKPTTPPVTVHIPSVIGEGPTPAYPPFDPVQDENWFDKGKRGYITQANVNMRSGPGLDYDVVGTLQQGEIVVADVEVERTGYNWVRVANNGWVADKFVQWEGPQPTPVPSHNERENWTRAIAFVMGWEGGWADHPSDPGGATNKGITIGTYTRWREQHGQPKPTKDDLRNITDAEANQIFYEWYWLQSQSDKLPWPLCLANFDTAVNAGTGRAAEMLQKSNGNFLAYMGHLIDWYTRINNFEHFGRAWIRRRADILLEASK